MVSLPTQDLMRKDLRENLARYVEEHPGEHVLIEGSPGEFRTTFYSTRAELDSTLERYKGTCGGTFLHEEIPTVMPVSGEERP